ncbi:hypothetical protein [Microbulbifer sp. SAOS-129_SWC]|uniref:hypothetical protein n=1 Tax=Microbulbifer sp. SAOS-129_SWC TaxID=3145235 RepID=UPI003217ECF8
MANPLALLNTGGGGFSGSSGVTDQSATTATSSTGTKNIGLGGNPNAAGRAVEKVFTNPLLLLAVVVIAWLFFRGR